MTYSIPTSLQEITSEKYVNCIIEYQAETGVTTDENGFSVPTSETKELRCRVYNQDGKAGSDNHFYGKDVPGELLWGRLSHPLKFPSEIVDLSAVTMVVGDRRGFARIKIKTQADMFSGSITGQKFDAVFKPE